MRKNIRQRFGARVKQLRTEARMTQEDLADRSGIGRVFISQIENGHKESCLDIMYALAETFKITLSELFKDI